MSNDTTEELAYNYGWEKWGSVFVRPLAYSELFINLDLREFGVKNDMHRITLKYNLTVGNIRTLIKLFGNKF